MNDKKFLYETHSSNFPDANSLLISSYANSMKYFCEDDSSFIYGEWKRWKKACEQSGKTLPPSDFKNKKREKQNGELRDQIKQLEQELAETNKFEGIVRYMHQVISDDKFAMTFQTLSQYRKSIIEAIDAAIKEKKNEN